MKKVLLTICFALILNISAYAFETNYFQKFINREIYLTIESENRERTVLMYLQKIDTRNNILVGRGVGGMLYVEVDRVVMVRLEDPTVHNILNPHRTEDE